MMRTDAPLDASPVPRSWAWIAFGLFATVMGTLSLLRYYTFHSRSLDMAFYVRLVWGMGNGHFDLPVVNAPHILGLHFEPMLWPFAGLSWLGLPIAPVLLIAQAAVTGAAVFPALKMAQRRLGGLFDRRMVFAASLVVLLLPTVTRCVDYDFHPVTLAIWPLMAFLNALDEGNLRRTWAWALFAMTFREDIGLQLACVAGAFVLWPASSGTQAPISRLHYALLTGAGLGWFLGFVGLIQPHFSPPTASMRLHFGELLAGRDDAGGLAAVLIGNPARVLAHLVSGDRPAYPFLLLAQLGFLPLLRPRYALGVLPLVGINVLSSFPGVRGLQAHYITASAPFLAAAGICGAQRARALLARWNPLIARRLPVTLLFGAALVAFATRGAFPLSPEWRLAAYRPDSETARWRALVARTPANAEVSAPVRVLAHLAERPVAHMGDEAGDPVIVLPRAP